MALRIVAILSLLLNTAFGYEAIGKYMPVSNVLEHSQINLDVAAFVAALKGEKPDYGLAKAIYMNGGGHSCKNKDTARTLQGFATKDLTGESYADAFYASGLPKDFWDVWFRAGLDGTGAWAKLGMTQRTVSLMKGAMGLVTLYASHELEAAIQKAKVEKTRTDLKSGHAWDEGWAFYYGTDGTSAPWEVAKKRDADFPEGINVQEGIVPYFNGGLMAVRKDTYNEVAAKSQRDVIYSMWAVTYMRAALKYLAVSEKAYGNGKAHAEGYAYWMAISGWAASMCKTEADALTAALDITQTKIPAGTFCATKKKIESCYSKLGISCEMVGDYTDKETKVLWKGIKCPDACSSSAVTPPKGAAAVAAVEGTPGDDVSCKPASATPSPAAPAGGDKAKVTTTAPHDHDDHKDHDHGSTTAAPGAEASSAAVSTVGIATLGVGLFLEM